MHLQKTGQLHNNDEPEAYKQGSIPFLGCTIDLSLKPFIPRPETEFWVEHTIALLRKKFSPQKPVYCLDLFAGSGCIGIALAHHLPNLFIDFGEVEKKYIEQIKHNLSVNQISSARAHVFRTNGLENIPKAKYNIIVANPPYIAHARKYLIQKSVIDWEPRRALFARDNGLFYVKKLLEEAPQYLVPNGQIFLEIDSIQKKPIQEFCRERGYRNISFWKDQYDQWRVVLFSNTFN